MYNKEHILSYKDDYEKEISELYSGRTIEDEIRNIINNYSNWQVYGSGSNIDLLFFDYDKNAINPFGEKIYDKDDAKYFGEIYRNEKETNISEMISITEQDDPRGIILYYDDYSIITIHSIDEIIWLDNKDNSDHLKLYFKYYELDDYYRKSLVNHLWDYDENSEAWYNRNIPENYRFAVRLINQYDLETQKNEVQQDNNRNVSNRNSTNTNNYCNDYEQRILDLLMNNGKMKAIDIAKKLGISRKEVNKILYYKLSYICEKDDSYRWFIKE